MGAFLTCRRDGARLSMQGRPVAMTAPAGTPGDDAGQSSESAPAVEADESKLGDPGKKALDSERNAREVAEKALKAANARIKQFEDAGKTELEKLTGERDEHKSRADSAESQLLKITVGLEKGLTLKQAQRLVGSTKAELEKDADELLEAFGAKEPKEPAGGKAREALKPTGGGNPGDTTPVTDPRKLADLIAGN